MSRVTASRTRLLSRSDSRALQSARCVHHLRSQLHGLLDEVSARLTNRLCTSELLQPPVTAVTMAVLSTSPLQFVASIPLVTRVFTAATVLASLLFYWLWWTGDENFSAPYLVLVPGSSLFYPWTFVTSALVETGVLEVRSPEALSDRHAYLFTAPLHVACNSCLSEVSGTLVGSRRNYQVHRSDGWGVKYHRVRS